MAIYKPSLLDKFKDFVNGLKSNWDQYEAHVADFEAHQAESAKKHITEIGENANGRYVRFDDGTQICWFYGSRSLSIPNAYGSLYQNQFTCTYPAPFISKPSVSIGQIQWGGSASWGMVSATYTETVTFRVIDAFQRSTASSMDISYIAIGRWQ